MVLHIGKLAIYSYDAKDSDQRHLEYVLENDNDFRKYVTKKLKERLRETPTGVTIQCFLFRKI